MGLMLLVTGIFGGIAIFIATLYSLAQVFLVEGRAKIPHVVAILCVLAVMAALQYREVEIARHLAIPLLAAGLWVMWVERGLYRIFPILFQLFAVVLIADFVAL
ncbi:MAG: hypothetical protein AAF713_05495 [Pseudomonadota bacterium]